MKRNIRLLIALCCIAVAAPLYGLQLLAASDPSEADDPGRPSLIHVIPVTSSIETGLQQFLDRALDEAEEAGADAAILEINTLGGRLDSAIEIGERLRGSSVRTIAYIQGKALSAGSYIALNADSIAMEPGSTIGAAAIVDGSGKRVTDSKLISAWRAEMRAAAELNGRNPLYAEGMVDDRLSVEVREIGATFGRGDLITFSAEEAERAGYAELIAADRDELLAGLELDRNSVIVVTEMTFFEQTARWLTMPAVAGLLLLIGFIGLGVELFVPGFGYPGFAGVAALLLYFGGHMIAGFAGAEHIGLFILGLLFLFLELFVPSFGILTLLGLFSLGSGVVMAAHNTDAAIMSLTISVLAAALIVYIVARKYKHRGVWNKLILRDEQRNEAGYVSAEPHPDWVGRFGKAVSPLRPSGIASFGELRLDVVSAGDYIQPGSSVEIVHVEGARIVVRAVQSVSETNSDSNSVPNHEEE